MWQAQSLKVCVEKINLQLDAQTYNNSMVLVILRDISRLVGFF